jgi:hypothetical protein
MQDGFFLRKKPFQGITFPLHQLENRYIADSGRLAGWGKERELNSQNVYMALLAVFEQELVMGDKG